MKQPRHRQQQQQRHGSAHTQHLLEKQLQHPGQNLTAWRAAAPEPMPYALAQQLEPTHPRQRGQGARRPRRTQTHQPCIQPGTLKRTMAT